MHEARDLRSPRGASERQCRALERAIGHPLPAAYRQYLLWIGRDRNGILRGSDCFIEHVQENHEALPELLAENQVDFELPSEFLVFLLHQGYVAAWFELPATDPDPVVWVFGEGQHDHPESPGRFSEWLERALGGG